MSGDPEKIALQRFCSSTSDTAMSGSGTSNGSNGSWNEQGHVQVGNFNPEYSAIPAQPIPRAVSVNSESTKQTPEYDMVHHTPGPPLPNRRTTVNTVYETTGNNISHPTTTMDYNQQQMYSGEVEAEPDYKEHGSGRCWLLVILSVLVALGLLLAIISVTLVMLMWFGLHTPNCPTQEPVSSNCSCPVVTEATLTSLMSQASSLTNQINQLRANVSDFDNSSSSDINNLKNHTNTLSESLTELNNTCATSLEVALNTPARLNNTEFEANLTNVGVFSQCVYEYLGNCSIGISDEECETEFVSRTVPGYYNIDLSCHVVITHDLDVQFAPVTNLQLKSGNTEMAACSCVVISANANRDRTETFKCLLFRSRCPISTTLTARVVT